MKSLIDVPSRTCLIIHLDRRSFLRDAIIISEPASSASLVKPCHHLASHAYGP